MYGLTAWKTVKTTVAWFVPSLIFTFRINHIKTLYCYPCSHGSTSEFFFLLPLLGKRMEEIFNWHFCEVVVNPTLKRDRSHFKYLKTLRHPWDTGRYFMKLLNFFHTASSKPWTLNSSCANWILFVLWNVVKWGISASHSCCQIFAPKGQNKNTCICLKTLG